MVDRLVVLVMQKPCLISGSVNNASIEQCYNQSVITEIARLAFFQYISHEAVIGYVSCVILDLLSRTKGSMVAQSVLPTQYQIKTKPNV